MTDLPTPQYRPPAPVVPALAPLPLDAARDRAVTLLTDRFADDSISEGEFEARLAWLGAATTAARVDELVADLAVPRAPLGYSGQGFTPAMPIPAIVPEVRIMAIMGQAMRTGPWTAPPKVRARALMSEVLIDFRYASLPPQCSIDVLAVMGKITIVVPPDIGVECSISPVMGGVHNEATAQPWGSVGAPRLKVTGVAVMAEVRIEVAPRYAR